jgi:hypothetical protein
LIGELIRQEGQWTAGGKPMSVIPASWVRRMRKPCALAPFYGWLTWLNPDGMPFPGASAESIFMVGAGGNYVWLEPKYQAVIVVRWIEPARFSSFASQVTRALEESA